MKQYCRICLAFDVRLFKLRDADKRKFIEIIFKHHGYYRILDENQNLCYICDALLTKSYSFVSRALRAQEVLYNLMKNNDMLSAVIRLVEVDRRKEKLNYTNLSFKNLNIGCIDESEAIPSIKDEIVEYDDDIINNSHNTDLIDTINVDNDNINPRNMDVDTSMDTKNTDVKEIEIKLEEPYVDIDVIGIKEPFNHILEENNPFDIIKEENNPLDYITIENNIIDVMPEGDYTLNSMSEGHDPFDSITEYNHDNKIDDFTSSQRNIDDVAVVNKTSAKHIKVGHKKKKIHNNNKQTELGTQEVHDVIVIDTDSVKSNDASVNDIKDVNIKVSENDMEWQESEKLKRKMKQQRKKYFKYKKPRKYVRNKPTTIRRREITLEENKDMIVEGKRKRKMAAFTNKKDTDSDTDECVMKKKIYKGRISSDDEYVPNSESADSECEREYPMTCEQCDSVLSSKREHFSHYLEMHPKIRYPHGSRHLKLVCEICGHAFYHKNHLASHLLTHGEKKLQCQHCPKMYHGPKQLNGHIIRVHGPKKFVCDYCDKRFPDKTNMKLHIRTHTGEKPYKCHICGDGFAHNGNRLLHVRVKHQNLPYPLQAKQFEEKLKKQNQKQDKKRKRKKRRTRESSSDDDDALIKYARRRKSEDKEKEAAAAAEMKALVERKQATQ